jgi:hypothetical protein
MPSFIVSPLVRWTMSVLGAAAVVHWVIREVRRVNAELDEVRSARVKETTRREELPTLRRDPRTGEYRL